MKEIKVFFQGKERSDPQILEFLKQLGGKLKNNPNLVFLLGSKSNIVEILTGVGIPCIICNMDPAKANNSKNDKNIIYQDFTAGGTIPKTQAWHERMIYFCQNADVAIFLPGSKGTLLHLIHMVAFSKAKIILIGWQPNDIQKLGLLAKMGLINEEKIILLGLDQNNTEKTLVDMETLLTKIYPP